MQQLKNIEVLQNVPLDTYSFSQIGGIADYLALPKNETEFITLLKTAKQNSISVTVLGQMSNVILSDDGVSGLIIVTEKMKEININNNQMTFGAGLDMITASEYAMRNSLSGLEWAAGLPGSVGGAVFMNAGAYGGNTSDNLVKIRALDEFGTLFELTKKDLGFTYRMSEIQRNNLLVTQATFELSPRDQNEVKAEMDDFNQRRIAKQPLEFPSNGSVFKRPNGFYSGKLIQDAGLQGKRIGGAQISNKHANFIVNIDNAKAADYLELINLVQTTIKNLHGIDMELEVKLIGRGLNQ
ncbi:MAG: UDP-N-acetylmuramate dehydrogenase [Lactobacillaceae bacterium]|nr:UDP-N-acetylmuramate dehydrogenase [Lactobacillaceae bacterium]